MAKVGRPLKFKPGQAALIRAAHKTLKAAAEAAGCMPATLRAALVRDGEVDSGPPLFGTTEQRPDVRTGAGTYILTSAQTGVQLNAPFWRNLRQYAYEIGAELMVAPVRYSHRPMEHEPPDIDEMPPELEEFLVDRPVRLCDGFEFTAHCAPRPTAVSPLSGIAHPPRVSSAIPHQKREVKVYPVSGGGRPVWRWTTGSVTVPCLSESKAGQRAQFHHHYGALIVEVDGDGDWWVRQLSADKDGDFYDLDTRVVAGEVLDDCASVRVLTLGDWHCEGVDKRMEESVFFGGNSIVQNLSPMTVVLHDFFDGRACNPHSSWSERYGAAVVDKLTVNDEVRRAGLTLGELASLCKEVVIVGSNHDDFLRRWLDTHDYRSEPRDALFFLELEMARLKDIENNAGGMSILSRAMHIVGATPPLNVLFIKPGGSHMVDGVDVGQHGHLGPNGARGSIGNLSKTAEKVTIGHSHTPAVREGVFQAGMSCLRKQPYTKGPSSWDFCAVLQYVDGRRTLLPMVEKGANILWRRED